LEAINTKTKVTTKVWPPLFSKQKSLSAGKRMDELKESISIPRKVRR